MEPKKQQQEPDLVVWIRYDEHAESFLRRFGELGFAKFNTKALPQMVSPYYRDTR